jgi:phenylalanyl-tRNA synthetase beta chain
VGLIGEVHPAVLDAYGLKQTAFVFELYLDAIGTGETERRMAAALPKYPSVARDITLIVDKSSEAGALLSAIREMGETLVEEVFFFDLYEGEKMPPGRKSLSLRVIYRSAHETLSDETVSAVHQRISNMLLTRFNATFPT